MEETSLELVVDAHAVIGESPVWSAAENAVYWCDIKGRMLHRTDYDTAKTQDWPVRDDIGGYALIPGSQAAIVALRSGLFRLNLESGVADRLADPPYDPQTHRFNESGIDPAGRLWLGEMSDPLPGANGQPADGALHSFTLDDGLVTHRIKANTANGFAWSADGATLMLAHTEDGYIERIAFDVDRGTLGTREEFARIDPEIGQPDGAAFDADGYYWCAIHKGGRLHRYASDGSIDRIVHMPVANPTMPAFCGPDLDVLYVTSATHGKPEDSPHGGGLFRFRPGVRGRPLTPFSGGNHSGSAR